MSEPAQGAHRILVVDDDPLVADSIRRMLVFDGHQVVLAGSGEEALALFSQGGFDLTLVDYEMPKMKGDKLAAALKAKNPSRPVVMFTGYAEAIPGEALKSGAIDAILGKPFDLQQLRQTLRQLLPPR